VSTANIKLVCPFCHEESGKVIWTPTIEYEQKINHGRTLKGYVPVLLEVEMYRPEAGYEAKYRCDCGSHVDAVFDGERIVEIFNEWRQPQGCPSPIIIGHPNNPKDYLHPAYWGCNCKGDDCLQLTSNSHCFKCDANFKSVEQLAFWFAVVKAMRQIKVKPYWDIYND